MAGHPNYHVNEVKLKGEIIWTGGLPHLPGVPPPPCNQALGNKARVDLVLIQPCLLYYVNHVFVILNSIF